MNKLMTTIIMCFALHAFAQDTLTLTSAIDRALLSNLQIKIARNEADIARNNNYPGNAGMAPIVVANVSDAPAVSNIQQRFLNGTEITRDNVASNNFNASLTAGFTLFDGGRMFATKDRLEELEKLGENNWKSTIQDMLSSVIQAYSNAVTQERYLEVLRQLNEVSNTRLLLTQGRMEAGLANNSDLFLAQLDINSTSQGILSQQAVIRNAITTLNTLLNFPADTAYVLQKEIQLNDYLQKEQLLAQFRSNPEYLAAENLERISLYAMKEASAARWPELGISATYGYSLLQSQAGFTLYNRNYGPSGLLTLSIPIFTGRVNSRNYENARVAYENAGLSRELAINNLENAFEQAWQLYEASRLQIESDIASVKTAKDYLDLIGERYKLGQGTVIDLREAQRSFEETNFRMINNRYLMKIAETDLLRLSGQLAR